ncbi:MULTISPECIES: fumarylacetoacetate hydrolase family protein [Actinomycetes]|uniref:2-keto-4-pentenoate hydratase n=1 Tax=Actinomycetes TaxID=1760 RepID=UPI00068BE8A4|nr:MULTISPECIES: fumarylacetoacetate hydrolase family protein [Actinomycetes]
MSVDPAFAEHALRTAREHRATRNPFSDSDGSLTEHWGYTVQALDRQHRELNGELVIGAKLGLTSAAKQRQMGVGVPIVGFVTDTMMVDPKRVRAELGRWAQPRIEPEIAFTTARPLGAHIGLQDVADLVATVSVAADIVDSRYSGYRFGLADVIGDNTSAAGVVLGAPHRLGDIGDLADLRCSVDVNGSVVHRALGSAILGSPLRSLVVLGEHLARMGQTLPAGSVVLAGAMTDAVPLVPAGRYRLRVEGLGEVLLDT